MNANGTTPISEPTLLEQNPNNSALLEAFIRNVPHLIVAKDLEGRIITANPLAERCYGIPLGQLLGKTVQDVLEQDQAKACTKNDAQIILDKRPRESEQTFHWSDGPHTFHTIKFPLFDSAGSLLGVGALGIDVTQYKVLESDLYQRANFDSVTSLPNRRYVMDRLSQCIALARRCDLSVGLLLIDIGNFTGINEALGHVAADALLADVAEMIRSQCRETDTVGRLNGDIFCVVLPNIRNNDEIDIVAAKILDVLKSARSKSKVESYLQPSIGIAQFPNHSSDSQDLLRCAKIALERAKKHGREKITEFDPENSGQCVRELTIAHKLRDAVKNNELRMVYQPIIDVKTGRITAAEALLRWHNPDLGTVPPDEFIRIAEESDTIKVIGEWAFKKACEDAKQINEGAPYPVTVAVNFSVKQLLEDNITEMIQSHLEEIELDPALIKIETTETAFANNPNAFQRVLEDLRMLGLGIALDDFGTGYSSLAYLHEYRFTQLKIDKSFIDGLISNKDGPALVESIIRMAHNLRLEVVAEGVEVEEQLEMLSELGCDLLQGYLISKPVPMADLMLTLVLSEECQMAA